MADIQISLHSIQEYKTVSIEGVGDFKIRKLSAPESLDLRVKERAAAEIVSKMYSTGINKYKGKTDDQLTEDDLSNIEEINKTIEGLSKEVEQIAAYKLNVNKSRFEDINGGDAVEKLFSTLSDEGIQKIFEAVFEDKTDLREAE